jgi:lipopolysaccharide export system permease protein
MKSRKLPWLRQRTDEGTTIIGADKTARGGLLLTDAVFLKLGDDGRIIERLDARTAELKQGYWELTDVTRNVRSHSREKLDRVEVKSGVKAEFVEEQFAEPEATPFYSLPRKIEAARSFGLNPNALLMQFNTLMALPFLLVAMTLIAATVSMRFTRLGQSGVTIVSGIVAGFLLYVVTVLVKAFGTAGLVPPFAAAWFPVIVAMFFGVTFLLHKEDG